MENSGRAVSVSKSVLMTNNKLEFSYDNFHQNYSHCTLYKKKLEDDEYRCEHLWLTGAVDNAAVGVTESRVMDSARNMATFIITIQNGTLSVFAKNVLGIVQVLQVSFKSRLVD